MCGGSPVARMSSLGSASGTPPSRPSLDQLHVPTQRRVPERALGRNGGAQPLAVIHNRRQAKRQHAHRHLPLERREAKSDCPLHQRRVRVREERRQNRKVHRVTGKASPKRRAKVLEQAANTRPMPARASYNVSSEWIHCKNVAVDSCAKCSVGSCLSNCRSRLLIAWLS